MTLAEASASNVRVVARIRPLSSKERERGSKESITSLLPPTDDETKVSTMIQVKGTEKRWYELDAVFGPNSSQKDVYISSGAQTAVCDNLFQGFNCTILAYGQTGAGKSFSMGTANKHKQEGIGEDDGIIPRACFDLFQAIQDKCDGNATVELSYLELYNEEIRDLFQESSADASKKNKLAIRETLAGEVYVSGTVSKTVSSPEEIGKYMDEASSRRVVASTAMNAVSSRSHAICTLRINGIMEGPDGTTDKFSSKLTLVDLAGSERIKKTGAQGARQAEGININKSLLVLGQVVSALSQQGRKRAPKPPYRDSKLTRLLQDSLGGNSRTIMLACVSPADFNLDESINTLRYATSARNIKNKATRNLVQNISQEEAAQLQRDNQLLRAQVKELQEMLQKMSVPSSKTEPPKRSHSTDEVDSTNDGSTAAETPESSFSDNETSSTGSADAAASSSQEFSEVEQLRKQLQAAQEEAKKAIEIPSLHMELANLKVAAIERDNLLEENEFLERELEQSKAEARSARHAATQLSDILDKLEELKRDEIEEKVQNLEQVRKEQQWISFVHVMLEGYRLEVGQLEIDFKKRVIQAIENLDFKEDPEKLKRLEEERQQRVQRRRSWWGGSMDDAPILPWKESTDYFLSRLSEFEHTIGIESRDLKKMQRSLERDVNVLQRDLRKKRVEYETMEQRPLNRENMVKEIATMFEQTQEQEDSFDVIEVDGSENPDADFDSAVKGYIPSENGDETENEDPTDKVTETFNSIFLEGNVFLNK